MRARANIRQHVQGNLVRNCSSPASPHPPTPPRPTKRAQSSSWVNGRVYARSRLAYGQATEPRVCPDSGLQTGVSENLALTNPYHNADPSRCGSSVSSCTIGLCRRRLPPPPQRAAPTPLVFCCAAVWHRCVRHACLVCSLACLHSLASLARGPPHQKERDHYAGKWSRRAVRGHSEPDSVQQK